MSSAAKLDANPDTPRRIGNWLKSRREELGLTQEQVVDRVRRAGAKLSRGHLSNFEAATYAPTPSLIAVLDLVLDGRGDLVVVAESLGIEVKSPLRADVIGFARRIHEGFPAWAEDAHGILDADARRTCEHVPASLPRREPRDSPPVSNRTIVGRQNVVSLVSELLYEAATRPPDCILLSGTFLGLRTDPRRAGLPHAIRDALRRALELGWSCRHFIPEPPESGPDAAGLVYIAAPLMPCPRYKPLLIDRGQEVTDNLLVIPGLASIELKGSGSASVLDAATLWEGDDKATTVLQNRLRHISSFSKEFVHHDYRHHDPWSPVLTPDEIKHREALNRMSTIEGPARLVVDRWPTLTIPPHVYAALVDRRREAAQRAFEQDLTEVEVPAEDWKRMTDLQKERFDNFETHLRERFPFQIIITPPSLRLPASNENHWRGLNLQERKSHFEYVFEMLSRYRNFQVALASDPLAQRIERCRWEVREQSRDSVVRLETHYTPGLNQNEWRPDKPPEEYRVDLEIKAPAAVQSFGAYFKHVWLQTKPVTPELMNSGR